MAGASIGFPGLAVYPNSTSAFTAVPTRRAFGSSDTYNASPRKPPPPPKKTTVFPLAVREYVQRCFASENAIANVTPEEMQARLKTVINDAASCGSLETMDWVALPLPQEMIVNDRKAAFQQSSSDAPHPLSDLSISGEANLQSPTANRPNSKKRKSAEMSQQNAVDVERAPAPWPNVIDNNVFENRLTYPGITTQGLPSQPAEKKQKKARNNGIAQNVSNPGLNDLERRRQRFGLESQSEATSPRKAQQSSAAATSGPVVGTCQSIEKSYFRLTAPPKAATVRPLNVLQQTLAHLQRKWKTEHNYSFICDQFKSLRQDLTVQHIKNDFTVSVYETHAHIALQKGDLGEYNQCQTQLRALYRQKLHGRSAEFLAYRILYFIYTGNRTDMNNLLAEITASDRKEAAVKHALDVRSALALGNYHRFFRLYLDAPNMGPYLMDMFIMRERLSGLAAICKSYKPDVSLRFLTEELAFEDDRTCAGFVCDHGGETLLEGRDSGPVFLSGKAGTIFENARAAAFARIDIKGQI